MYVGLPVEKTRDIASIVYTRKSLCDDGDSPEDLGSIRRVPEPSPCLASPDKPRLPWFRDDDHLMGSLQARRFLNMSCED